MTERAAVRRRVVAVIAMGALAVGGLTACRTDSGSAAYVGNTRISNADVDGIVASLPKNGPVTAEEARQLTITYGAFNALAAKVAASKGLGTAKPDKTEITGIASELKVDPSNKFVQTIAQGDAWRTLLMSKAPKVTPNDVELKQIYQNLVSAGNVFQGTPPSFEEVRSELLTIPDLDQGVGLYREMTAAAAKSNISVNPRYAAPCTASPCASLEFPVFAVALQSGQSVTVLNLQLDDEAHPVVVDQTPAPTAS